MWFLLSILSALIYSFRTLAEKLFIEKINPYILAFGVRAFAIPFFLLPIILQPSLIPKMSDLTPSFWISVLYISMISTPIEMIFLYKALKKAEMSYVTPLLALGPIITVSINAFLFKDFPTLSGVLGVTIVVFGIYLLNVDKSHTSLLDPIKHLFRHDAFRYLCIMLLFNASSIVVDKIGITTSNVYFYALINYLFISVSLFVIAKFKANNSFGQLKEYLGPFFLIGIVIAAYTFLRFLAIEQGNTGYVSAVLSSSTIFSIILGVLFLHEKGGKRKIMAGVVLLLGLVIIKIYG